MRKVREVLRLKYESGRSHAEIAASLGIGESTVGDYLARARRLGLTWESARELGEVELESRLFRDGGRNEPPAGVAIDFAWVHRELARPSVTLQTVWVEYREAAAAEKPLRPYEYSRFCDLYARWKKALGVVMRQVHRAGEKVFIDYSGKRPRIVDRETGEVTEVELFVAVLGASNYTFAEATRSQKLADFVGSTIRAFEYFGAVPEIAVPDQLRSAVRGPDRYEPDINPTYLEMAQHYGVTIIPARPRRPRDKAKVEGGVLIAQRWILAALRHRTFFRDPCDRKRRRDPSQGRPRRVARALLRPEGDQRDRRRASSPSASRLRPLAARADGRLGGERRTAGRRSGDGDHEPPYAPRDGVPRVPRTDPPRRSIRPGARRHGVHASSRDRKPELQERGGHPQERSRSHAAGRGLGSRAHRARAHSRRFVFRQGGRQ